MKILSLIIIPAIAFSVECYSQKIYNLTGGELIFSFSDIQLNQDFENQNENADISQTNLRFTAFFHLGTYWHFDFNNNLGLYTGLGIRNIGLSSNEILPLYIGSTEIVKYKIVRRVYTLGIPLSFKVGSFNDHIYFFTGGEYELALHYKEKYWENTHSRSGVKTKSGNWFGDQTLRFLPSVFAGIQMSGGFNIRFKYYLTDFLNNSYNKDKNNTPGNEYNISDLSRYENSQLFYISICWQFEPKEIKAKNLQNNIQVALK